MISPLTIQVTEDQSEVKVCTCGCVNSNFPLKVSHYVQYRPRIKGLLVYLQNYHKISCGSLHNTQKYAYNKLEYFEFDLKSLLTLATIAGLDKTGFRVLTTCWWLHSCSTDSHAYYEVHKKEVMKRWTR